MADQSTNIPWTQGMNYGIGVNLLNGDIAGKAVDPGTITGPTQAGGQTTRYNLAIINSFEELCSSIGISVEASGHYGLFSASGKFSYAKESKFNSQATFLLARCVVENAFTQAEDAQIKTEASKLLEQGKTDLFQQRYGDGFVRGMQTGGEFFAVISVTSSSQEEQESIAASLQAKYGGLFASVQVDVNLDDKTKSKIARSELRVSTYQRGGSGDDQSLTADIEAVMARLKAFPTQVKNSPVPYDVQVANYNTLALPEGPNTIDIQAQKEALVDYERIHLKLLTLRNDIEFLQLHPNFFIDPPDNVILNQWQDFITNQINQVTRQASTCIDNPKDGCPILSLKLPDNFREVKRKLLNSIDIKAAAQSWPSNVVMRKVDTPKDFTVSTRLVTQFTQQEVPGYFGVGLVLASETTNRCIWFLKGVGNTGQSISCYAFNISSGDIGTSRVGVTGVLYPDDEVYLRMSKKGDQLLDLSYSKDGQDWNPFFEGSVDLTSIGFTANDSYKLALSAYSTEVHPVSGSFFDVNVFQI
jgi:hypothetical protein